MLLVFAGGGWLVYRNFREEQARARRPRQIEWPGVLPLTPDGRDVYATVVLRTLGDTPEPDLALLTDLVGAADAASFEQASSPDTHRHHAAFMSTSYRLVAVSAVLGADPYRADEESIVDAALLELGELGAIPARRRRLARRAMTKLVKMNLVARSAHGEAQLRRQHEVLSSALADIVWPALPSSW